MKKKTQIIIVIWLSVLTMLLGCYLIFFGVNNIIVAGAILFGSGLVTIGLMMIGLNMLTEEEEEILNNQYQKEILLMNGRILQIVEDLGYSGNTKVRIDNEIPEDGFYVLSEGNLAYKVQKGKIKMEYYIETFKQEDGSEIEIGGSRITGIGEKSPVWKEGTLVPDGVYKKGWGKISVVNGLVEKKN